MSKAGNRILKSVKRARAFARGERKKGFVVEDAALVKAIEMGTHSKRISRTEVFKVLRRNH